MFKKLKQKITEEQSPQRNAQSPPQAQMGSGERRSSQTPPFHHDGSPSPSDREVLAGMIAEPAFLSEYTIFALDHSNRPKTAQVASVGASKGPVRSPRGSINGDGIASPHREEPQSFAQKLQFKVPSMESLIRGGASRAESLFRSPSKDNLVRSSSRESLTPLGENDSPGAPTYDPPSDIESEAEEPQGTAESLSKEQLLHRLFQVESSLGKYRGKYSELVTAYRTVQRDKEKTQVILSQSQDKALRRIGELREELQMDQQAKKHLQEEFDAVLEEKDQRITVLQTQVALLKKRVKVFSDETLPPENEVPQSRDTEDSASAAQSPSKEQGAESEGEGNSDPAKLMEALQKRVTRQESLLQKCKELIRTHKERSAQLGSENETLQEQLQERLQELEKMKGMVIAETKRQMHETLEIKEEEIAQLRSRLQQTTSKKEELQDQKEKAEKSAFEELERALGVAQKAEEARKQLQVQLEEQVKNIEMEGEEERKKLQQELTRVKQEVVIIMKKSSEETVAGLEKLHSETLATKEAETNARISKAVEECKAEFAQLAKEQEQQSSLALEDADLQKTAVRTEAESTVKELQLELETARTRILELESSMEKFSEEGASLSNELSSQMDELQDKLKVQICALQEKHQEQMENHKCIVNQHHDAVVEELKENHRVEVETLMKEKEMQFQAHVEDMNQKTFEKLDAKQAELEALSSEHSEALATKQLLEEKLVAAEEAHHSARKEHKKKFQDQAAKHSVKLANIKQEHEQSFGGVEKTLKQELNAMQIVLREKEKEIGEHVLREKTLQEQSNSNIQELHVKVKELEELQQSLSQSQLEYSSLKESNAQLSKIMEELDQCKKDLADLEHQLEAAKKDCQQKEKSLQEQEHQLQQTKKDISEKEKSFTAELNTKQEEQTCFKKQLDEKNAHEKKMKNTITELETKVKSQETKMEKFKQKAKEMQENFKKKLQQNDETMKKELAKKATELQQKEQQVQEKILEMAQKSSHGLSTAMTELQANHKEEVEKLRDSHKRGAEEMQRQWQEKFGQQEEELMEKHSVVLQEKAQELVELSQQLGKSREDTDQVMCEMKDLKEELAIRETTVQKLQEELNEAAVKLESLSQGEAMLKEQMESVERNLNQAMNERNALQDKLSAKEEESREKMKSLSDKLEETETQLKALESSRFKESDDLQNKCEEAARQLQAKEAEFQQQLIMINKQLENYCQEVQSQVECGSNELRHRVECRVNELKDRLLCSQRKVGHLKNTILTKADRICTLEETLHRQMEENQNLCISLEQTSAQVSAHAEHIKALTNVKENHSMSIGDKVQKIEELREANRIISDSMKANEAHISDLESIVSDLKNQLEICVKEKEEAINHLKQQYEEERQQEAVQMKETIERLEQERKSASEQADALRSRLSEYENKAEIKFVQNDNTITSLLARLEELELEMSEKNEALRSLTASIDNQSISKSEMDQVLSEKEQKLSGLTSELESCVSRLAELQEQLALKSKECEQLAADLKQQHSIRESNKRELEEQLQQTQMQSALSGNSEQEMAGKLHSLEEDNQKCKLLLESQREEFERIKSEIIKSKEESLKATAEKLSAESARKVSELKKKAEQKIGQIKKQLTSQLEEKEQTIKALQTSVEEIKSSETSGQQQIETLEERLKTLEEALVKLREEQERELEQTLRYERLEKEKSVEELKTMYEEKLTLLQTDTAQQGELKEAKSALQEIEAKLKEAEEQNQNLLAEINHLKEEMREREARLNQHQETIKQPEVVAEMTVECSSAQQTKSVMENQTHNHSPLQEEDGDSLESLKSKLSRVSNEKEKIHKDFTRLQKDVRLLRKEHEQDIEYMKKELLEENEKNLKMELEDVEMKHNSAIKHLMREINTQMALKESELESAVKEAIGEAEETKAQSVEAELITSHREEASQFRKVITQKDDDLHRTVQKYEEVIQSREEEMGDRVWQVQKELEDLRATSHGPAEMSSEELQTHLAEKTTLLSEARLKEQEFVERIHSLEDKIKCFTRKTVVTHLGSTFKDSGFNSTDALSETTELEYLRKVFFEYMMGRETKTMAKVITSMLKFSPDQAQKVLDIEDSKTTPWLR
ncbi:golgin subfamily A member 4 isoform X3 [Limanda limanda]|uniref:golgin subfamily A member 4 isoform X3 n=1 Tax=Limanda limanda TaxID=27771 RepID=UPI0029C77293|nr:golgin subfamily A member 4 isoform X3 [Limanda limanda]